MNWLSITGILFVFLLTIIASRDFIANNFSESFTNWFYATCGIIFALVIFALLTWVGE